MAGWNPAKDEILLTKGADFKWSYEWQGGTFPENVELYYLLGSDEKDANNLKWTYDIDPVSRKIATIKIESDDADKIENRTPFRLLFKRPGSPHSDETVIAMGNVKRVEPR